MLTSLQTLERPIRASAGGLQAGQLARSIRADLRALEPEVGGAASSYHAGQIIFSQGDAADSYYRVTSGMVRTVRYLEDGRRQVLGFVEAGQLFGVSCETCQGYGAEAVTDVTLVRHSLRRFGRELDASPAVLRDLLGHLVGEVRAIRDFLVLLGRKTAPEKVASFLLDRAGKALSPRQLTLAMSRADIADHLGLTVETVSRILAAFKRSGVIALTSPSQVQIRDRDALLALAEGCED